MESTAAFAEVGSWTAALDGIGLVADGPAPAPDLAILFASPDLAGSPELAEQVYRRSAASVLIGCTGQGVATTNREVEGKSAVSLLSLMLPGATLHPRHVNYEDITPLQTAAAWRQWVGLAPEAVNAWVVLADPFTFDPETLIAGLTSAYPDATIIGGLASGSPRGRGTNLFFNGQTLNSGAIILAIGGAYTIQTVVAQGAAPIGEPWTITEADENVVHRIGNRPALDVLRETLAGLSDGMRRRASQNLLVGLAMNEYKDHFEQGDFLIRNLIGADQGSGALAIGALPQVGQTIQFQVRDATAADQDLQRQLAAARDVLGDAEVAGAMLCTCNGRGVGLFGQPDHDAHAIHESFGPVPLAGFFCNGEIGPVGPKTYLHGFTASIALFVPKR